MGIQEIRQQAAGGVPGSNKGDEGDIVYFVRNGTPMISVKTYTGNGKNRKLIAASNPVQDGDIIGEEHYRRRDAEMAAAYEESLRRDSEEAQRLAAIIEQAKTQVRAAMSEKLGIAPEILQYVF